MIIHIFSVKIFTAEIVEIPSNISVQNESIEKENMYTFSQYTLLLDFSTYYLSLLKMWILLQHMNMEYESIEKGNHVTAVQDSGGFHSKL